VPEVDWLAAQLLARQQAEAARNPAAQRSDGCCR
jgi:hypothetical protein